MPYAFQNEIMPKEAELFLHSHLYNKNKNNTYMFCPICRLLVDNIYIYIHTEILPWKNIDLIVMTIIKFRNESNFDIK